MKETKRAEFDNIGLDAVFVNGNLDHLSVWGPGIEPRDISAAEAGDLYVWLGSIAVMSRSGSIATPTPGPSPDPLRGWIATANLPSSTVGLQGRISDAQSVKNRVPLDRALASEGMKLDDLSSRISAPVQVRIEK